MGFSNFETMKSDVPISNDPANNALLKKVGHRIADVANLPGAQWEFVLFDSPEANAFCLPGGKVGVYTGILPVTKDEAGLATVIGHEVAHAEYRHGNERVSQAMLTQLGGSLVQSGLAAYGYDAQTQAVAASAYGMTAQLGLALPHNRTQESEADYIGLLRMAQAGYPPEASVAFWERFASYKEQGGDGGPPWFLRTHPMDEKRIADLKKWIPEARAQFRPNP